MTHHQSFSTFKAAPMLPTSYVLIEVSVNILFLLFIIRCLKVLYILTGKNKRV